SATRRLRREFDSLRNFNHPNIVRVLDMGELEGIPWLSMEFVDGMVLREWLVVAAQPQPLGPEPVFGTAQEGVDLDVLFEEPDSGALLAAARAALPAGDGHRGHADARGAGGAEQPRTFMGLVRVAGAGVRRAVVHPRARAAAPGREAVEHPGDA